MNRQHSPGFNIDPLVVGFLMFAPWALVHLWLVVKARDGWSGGYYWVTDVEIHSLSPHWGHDLLLLVTWLTGLTLVCLVRGRGHLHRRLLLTMTAVLTAAGGTAALLFVPAAALGGWLPGPLAAALNRDLSTAGFTVGLVLFWGFVCLLKGWAVARCR